MKHNWKHAKHTDDFLWKCKDCGMLDWNAIPDTDQECSGSISEKIEDEINTLRYWQHDETLRVIASEFRPSAMWGEIEKEEYEKLIHPKS